MLHRELVNPASIAVIGGSNNLRKPGGKILQNLREGNYTGDLYVVNPKEETVQGVKCFSDADSLPQTELAVLAIAARFCPDVVETMVRKKGTRGFIVLSAGFGEESAEGRAMEMHMAAVVESVGGSMIGPNCIGVINQAYRGVFTSPIPKLDPKGCDFISGSGATAVFIMEAGIPNGLTFSSVYSVGNSAQTGAEDVLRHLDESFDPETSSRTLLLYIENIEKPHILLRHASSLTGKGCRIAAIKSGTTEAGSRAASSHTGALSSPDTAVDALFRKAGIVRCHSREELIAVASVFQHKELNGNRLAIITHAGGPAVMLTDTLSEGGLEVPPITGPRAEQLLDKLQPGSSASNPIDILATGGVDELGIAIDYCEKEFEDIDGMIVIFGTPGLFRVHNVYRLLDEKMKSCSKPIFPVLPSIVNARDEIDEFISFSRINFPDEVRLGRALSLVNRTRAPVTAENEGILVDVTRIRQLIGGSLECFDRVGSGMRNSGREGYLNNAQIREILDAAGIPRAREENVTEKSEAVVKAEEIGFPVVMKVIGPLHKSDVGGVVLNVDSAARVSEEFERMSAMDGVEGVLIQPMLGGMELFAGAKREGKFGHLVLTGMGGIFIETLRDICAELAPLTDLEAGEMIRNLKSYPIIQGVRGQEGIRLESYRELLVRLSQLVMVAPEIEEMDLNPLLGSAGGLIAVDARIRLTC